MVLTCQNVIFILNNDIVSAYLRLGVTARVSQVAIFIINNDIVSAYLCLGVTARVSQVALSATCYTLAVLAM